MLNRLSTLLVHVCGLALVCAVGAYWVIRIVTPAPSVAPAPVAPAPPREPDPVLAARMFGKVQTTAEVASNMQVVGVFAAGAASAAVISVDGKPAHVYLVGQEVADGLALSEVRGDGVSLSNSAGGAQELRVAQRASANFSNAAGPRLYSLDRGVMSAPPVEGTATGSGAGAAPRPAEGARPAPPAPQFSPGGSAQQPLQPPPPPPTVAPNPGS